MRTRQQQKCAPFFSLKHLKNEYTAPKDPARLKTLMVIAIPHGTVWKCCFSWGKWQQIGAHSKVLRQQENTTVFGSIAFLVQKGPLG